jgi:hypothetical protein
LTVSLLPGCRGERAAVPREFDEWEVATFQGQRIGHLHTTVRCVSESGQTRVKVSQSMQVSVRRFGDVTNMGVECSDNETPDGRLIDFESTANLGAAPMRTTGKVVGNRLEVQVESQGQKQTYSVAWPADAGGFLAPLLSLRAAPLKAGEKRTVKHVNFDGQISSDEMTAQKEEEVELWNGSRRLLKVDSIERIDSESLTKPPDIRGTLWTDSSGEPLKSWIGSLGITFYRVSEGEANTPVTAQFDLGKATLVKIEHPVRRPHDTKWIRYRIHLDGGDPLAAFPAGPSQEVKRIDEHTAEVTVRAIRPASNVEKTGSAAKTSPAADAPTDNDLKPNNFIQSDDPQIVAQAKEAVGNDTDPWKQALALEAYVHRKMTVIDFSQAFATAAEAARSGKGDCKAHAVYLAALARARNIPARVVVGLVYMPQSQTFGGHMWTEVYVDGRWIGLDGTLGKGGIGGGHLKLAHSSMAGVGAYDVLYSMLRVIQGLKIDVLDYE